MEKFKLEIDVNIASFLETASQKIVDSGKKGMLFTDLANPTSNSIYSAVAISHLQILSI